MGIKKKELHERKEAVGVNMEMQSLGACICSRKAFLNTGKHKLQPDWGAMHAGGPAWPPLGLHCMPSMGSQARMQRRSPKNQVLAAQGVLQHPSPFSEHLS